MDLDDDLVSTVIQELNTEVGNDIKALKNIPDLFKKYSEKKQTLQSQFTVASNEAPNKITHCLHEADSILNKIRNLEKSESTVQCEVLDHLSKVDQSVNQLQKLQNQIKIYEQYIKYLKWITNIDDISSGIQAALVIKSDDRAVADYESLAELFQSLQTSNCLNLVSYVNQTVIFWHNLLKKKFGGELEEILKSLKWPIVATSQLNLKPDLSPQLKKEAVNRIKVLFNLLLHLKLPDNILRKNNVSEVRKLVPEFKSASVPLQLLLRQLRKRFIYHFMGKKQTNSLEKPEWYFTQVLSWIRDNSFFLEQVIQPILIENNYGHVSAKAEFIRGLVEVISEKLYDDIPQLLDDDHLLSHTIDEALSFDKELLSFGYSGMDSQPGVLTILTADDVCFNRWLGMEKKYAMAKIDEILSLDSSWKSVYVLQGEIDELKVPQCAEQFMTLIHTITGRYKCVNQPIHKLNFLNVQLDLLDDFRLRLVQLMKEQQPFDDTFCPILNAINYMITVLSEWGDLPFFLQMHCYKIQYNELRQSMDDGQMTESLRGEQEKAIGSQLSAMHKSGVLLEKMPTMSWSEGTVFDDLIGLLKHVQTEMILKLVDFVVMDVKAKSRAYRNNKWFSMKNVGGTSNMSVSSTLCPILIALQFDLQKLKGELAENLFSSTWKKIASQLDEFIIEEVVLQNTFNEGGSSQFNHDMNRNMFSLFSEFTQRPENYFKEVKESCILLSLAKGSALLLHEVLSNESAQASKTALEELGVNKLKYSAALNVLNRRNDLQISH